MTVTRIDNRFAALASEGRAGLVTFITAGDPDYETSLAIVNALPEAGADIIELGVPFTDAMADGPPIQASSLRALAAGQTLIKTIAMVREFRKKNSETPIVLMGYYNPIYIYGVEKFLKLTTQVLDRETKAPTTYITYPMRCPDNVVREILSRAIPRK